MFYNVIISSLRYLRLDCRCRGKNYFTNWLLTIIDAESGNKICFWFFYFNLMHLIYSFIFGLERSWWSSFNDIEWFFLFLWIMPIKRDFTTLCTGLIVWIWQKLQLSAYLSNLRQLRWNNLLQDWHLNIEDDCFAY
jgi:hypothetical protein